MELSRLTAIKRMVEEDMGIGIVPLQSVQEEDLIANLKGQSVVGDIMYHFLKQDGSIYPRNDTSRNLESINPKQLYHTPDVTDAPPIYSVSPDGLRDIAKRGVCLLVVHTASRAAVTHAALRRKSVNLIVITAEAADRLLKL